MVGAYPWLAWWMHWMPTMATVMLRREWDKAEERWSRLRLMESSAPRRRMVASSEQSREWGRDGDGC